MGLEVLAGWFFTSLDGNAYKIPNQFGNATLDFKLDVATSDLCLMYGTPNRTLILIFTDGCCWLFVTCMAYTIGDLTKPDDTPWHGSGRLWHKAWWRPESLLSTYHWQPRIPASVASSREFSSDATCWVVIRKYPVKETGNLSENPLGRWRYILQCFPHNHHRCRFTVKSLIEDAPNIQT